MIFLLLVLFQIKHFVADYPLQTPYMLKKFLPGKGFILPLLAHCLVHASFTFLISICLVDLRTSVLLALFDVIAHFCMDRVKASPNMLGKFKTLTPNEMKTIIARQNLTGNLSREILVQRDVTDAQALRSNKLFWWSLGLDQGVHHLTHYVIIAVLVGAIK